ncbi:chloramphenicol acetyltransferase [Aureibaculum algae]|uniref:Chloramphenicol acetyltransferase n=1 Tax=Aureibaculum algae TaxID=2584122 RepID=A0A5B7TU40_9FLAO|nr:CatA-like O-acetyltransferase [Aureibaculum algae]QCX38132.1 chloramphenicol acetyltransferase [Aureibaculum algae]
MKIIDIENWDRKNQYDFFKNYEDPFFNITATLEVTNLYRFCKVHKLSFFLAGLYVANKAMNQIPEFKLRLDDGKVIAFDDIDISSTVLNDDDTFSFCHFESYSSIFEFIENGLKTIENLKNSIVGDSDVNAIAVVHSTTIPWVSITGFKHARNGNEKEIGIPKIVFGKYYNQDNRKIMPFSVEVHHALMDGIHVGLLYEKMQYIIDHLK